MTTISNRDTLEPADQLDGAQVTLWAFSPKNPYFIMKYSDGSPYKPIHGFAVCRYGSENLFYFFSCDIEWNVESDQVCDNTDEALLLANTMTNKPVRWNKKIA